MSRSSRPRAHSLRRETMSRAHEKDCRSPPSPMFEEKKRDVPPSTQIAHTFRRLTATRNRRILWVVLLALAITSLLFRLSVPVHLPIGLLPSSEPVCEFVSTTEAYQRDLHRQCDLHKADCRGYSRSQRAHHTYSPTGHYVLSNDTSAPHPIPQLLALGEKRWEELLARQSQTLGEAVREYERRYDRPPPKGFDKWWTFATQHGLVLPDEYDRINLDLAPFWALPKAELRQRLHLVENMPEVFVLEFNKSRVSIHIKDRGGLAWEGTMPRARQTASMLQSIARYLPDMKATFSIFDQPQIYLSWARRSSLATLGLKGMHTTHLDEPDDGNVQLRRSCSPNSTLRMDPSFYEGKSFVFDGLEASDLCQNPYLVPLHGLTIEPHTPASHPRPHTRLLPLFSLAKTSINSDILITPLEQFSSELQIDRPWEKKRDPRLLWRGSPTGISMMTKDVDWRQSHRWRLHQFANTNSTEEIEFIVPNLAGELGLKTETAPADEAAKFFFDMHLTGEPIQCSEEDGTCDDMANEIAWSRFQPRKAAQLYKFILDIDGNGWSGRFRHLMSSNSVVVKTGIFTEWFQPHLIPWFMYIPAKLDFSDLTDIMAFFTGSPGQPHLAFDQTAKALGQNGKCFVQRMFRYEDMQAYMLRLFLEYARIVAPEGEDMDFHYDLEEEDETESE